jgi:hypothetical protein
MQFTVQSEDVFCVQLSDLWRHVLMFLKLHVALSNDDYHSRLELIYNGSSLLCPKFVMVLF